MGVDYFNCSRCNTIECDCGEYVSCICGNEYCIDCANQLELQKQFGTNDDGFLNYCFECYHVNVDDKKMKDFQKKIEKYERMLNREKDKRDAYIIKYHKKHQIRPKVDEDANDTIKTTDEKKQ